METNDLILFGTAYFYFLKFINAKKTGFAEQWNGIGHITLNE